MLLGMVDSHEAILIFYRKERLVGITCFCPINVFEAFANTLYWFYSGDRALCMYVAMFRT